MKYIKKFENLTDLNFSFKILSKKDFEEFDGKYMTNEDYIINLDKPFIDITDNNEYDKFLYDKETNKLRREQGVSKNDIFLIEKYHKKMNVPCRITDFSEYYLEKPHENFINIVYKYNDNFPSFEIKIHKYEYEIYIIDLYVRSAKKSKNLTSISLIYKRYLCDDIEGYISLMKYILVKYPFIKNK